MKKLYTILVGTKRWYLKIKKITCIIYIRAILLDNSQIDRILYNYRIVSGPVLMMLQRLTSNVISKTYFLKHVFFNMFCSN